MMLMFRCVSVVWCDVYIFGSWFLFSCMKLFISFCCSVCLLLNLISLCMIVLSIGIDFSVVVVVWLVGCL